MILFRIARSKYIDDLTGEGARIYGGRWNQKGTAVLYTSLSESLATLETLAHTPISAIPGDLKLLILSVPDDMKMMTVAPDKLPETWRNYPALDDLKNIGTEWVNAKSSLLLKVPSALVQTEWNMLINPSHNAIVKIKIQKIRDFSFDTRLLA